MLTIRTVIILSTKDDSYNAKKAYNTGNGVVGLTFRNTSENTVNFENKKTLNPGQSWEVKIPSGAVTIDTFTWSFGYPNVKKELEITVTQISSLN